MPIFLLTIIILILLLIAVFFDPTESDWRSFAIVIVWLLFTWLFFIDLIIIISFVAIITTWSLRLSTLLLVRIPIAIALFSYPRLRRLFSDCPTLSLPYVSITCTGSLMPTFYRILLLFSSIFAPAHQLPPDKPPSTCKIIGCWSVWCTFSDIIRSKDGNLGVQRRELHVFANNNSYSRPLRKFSIGQIFSFPIRNAYSSQKRFSSCC